MTDAEIEQARKSLEPPLEPLYVDSKADIRSVALLEVVASIFEKAEEYDTADMIRSGKTLPYNGDGSIVRPFMTVAEAREVQKPGQNIVIAGYATIGAARVCPDSVEHKI